MAFKMVTPSTIDDTTLTSSTVAEPSGDDPVEYNAANNFSVGDFISGRCSGRLINLKPLISL